jgi:hypothetical protein
MGAGYVTCDEVNRFLLAPKADRIPDIDELSLGLNWVQFIRCNLSGQCWTLG